MCKTNPKWAKRPRFVIIHPGPQGRPHSGSWLPTTGSFKNKTNLPGGHRVETPRFGVKTDMKKQNEPNFPFFNRKSNLENRKLQNEPKVGEASLLRYHSPRPEGTSKLLPFLSAIASATADAFYLFTLFTKRTCPEGIAS
jgi:hypothetical protein